MAPVIPQDAATQEEQTDARPIPHPTHPKPLLRLNCTNLRDPQTRRILQDFDVIESLDTAVNKVLSLLYPPATEAPKEAQWPGTRSVTFFVDDSYDGVAYTTGIQLDDDHKEIHLSTRYVGLVPASRFQEEIHGVIVHEMVHCWQWTAQGTPGGLIEGIADWVRLRAELGPPHWKRELDRAGGPWKGYQHTAYFLNWLEEGGAGNGVGGKGTVPRVNEALRGTVYEEGSFWKGVIGEDIKTAWEKYCDWLERDLKVGSEGAETEAGASGA